MWMVETVAAVCWTSKTIPRCSEKRDMKMVGVTVEVP